jgi:hypothetical protein
MSNLRCEASVLMRQCERTNTQDFCGVRLCTQHANRLKRYGQVMLYSRRQPTVNQWLTARNDAYFVDEQPKATWADGTVAERW